MPSVAPAALAVTLPQALAFRLRRQYLATPAPDGVAAATALLGAQAQVHSAGVLQLRARSPDFDTAAADRALYSTRTLVKMWAQRSTLHFTPTADLGPILALRRLRCRSYHAWYAREGLAPDQVDRLVTAIIAALREGPHSRADLSRRLTPVLGEWARPWLEHSWGGAVKLVSALGHACHGPARAGSDGEEGVEPSESGAESRGTLFVSLPDWVQVPQVLGERPAMALLLRRYLAVFGPASASDFRKFIGVEAGPVRQAFTDLAPDLVPIDLVGRPAFALADDESALRTAEPPEGHLAVLPLFDPWLLAHAETGQYLDDRHRKAVYRTAGWISPVVLRQGRVVATWSHKAGPAGWALSLTPLERLRKGEKAAILARIRHLGAGVPVRWAVRA